MAKKVRTEKERKAVKEKNKVLSKEEIIWDEILGINDIFDNSKNELWCDIVEHSHSPQKVVCYNVFLLQREWVNEEEGLFNVHEKDLTITTGHEYTHFSVVDTILYEGDPNNVSSKNSEIIIDHLDKPICAKIKVLMSEIIEKCNKLDNEVPPKCECCDRYCLDGEEYLEGVC